MKRLLPCVLVCVIALGLFGCASDDKYAEQGMAELLKGPYYTVTVRSMIREKPDLDAEATGVLPAGQEVHMNSMSENEEWAFVAAHSVGEVVFAGWIPADRIKPSEE